MKMEEILAVTEGDACAVKRRVIFSHGDFEVVREPDGIVTASIAADMTFGRKVNIPARQWQKLVAAFALEPDLWPGCDCDIKIAQANVGKPQGGPLS